MMSRSPSRLPELAAVILVVVVAAGLGVLAVLPPLLLVVASRGLVSANATVLGVKRAAAAGAASAVLGTRMFGGGILVSPLIALGGDGTAIPMALLTRGDHPEPDVDANARRLSPTDRGIVGGPDQKSSARPPGRALAGWKEHS